MITIKKFKNQWEAEKFLKEKIGAYDEGAKIMAPKTEILNVFVKDVKNQAAAILKQDILSIGGDAAIHADVVRFEKGVSDVLLMATLSQLNRLTKKLKIQPYGLENISEEIDKVLINYFKQNKQPQIMGILNLTPDSFFDGGKFNSIETASAQAQKMINEGADILDVGAESSRPGFQPISEEEELARLLPVLKELRKNFKIKISVDTYKPNVARAALAIGADIINDISGELTGFDCPIILMHNQKKLEYSDVVLDIIEYFGSKNLKNVIIDPGIGFGKGKTVEHNLEILKRIEEFKVLGVPILVGASRKSFIGKEVNDRLFGSLAVATLMAERGVDILRVHDVGATRDVLRMVEKLC